MTPLKVNEQPVEKVSYDPDVLEVHSVFPTIQGEGPLAGTPATFVRMSGCVLQCPGCDTEYVSKRETYNPWELYKEVWDYKNELVVITGGEPLRQNLSLFTRLLVAARFKVQVETSGSVWNDLPPEVMVVVSPKCWSIFTNGWNVVAYKYVIDSEAKISHNGIPESVLGREVPMGVAHPPPDFRGDVFYQPADEGCPDKNRKNLERCLELCKKYGRRLSLQTHKIIGVE